MFLKSILVPLDGSPLSEQALPYATELAGAARASLTLVRTAEVQPSLPLPHLRPEDPWRYLHVHADLLRRRGLVVDTAVAPGKAPRALVSAIERRQPDLVVMSTHGRSGIDRLVHGSMTDAVISHAGSPVLLLRAQASSEASAAWLLRKRVLVPLDGSSFSEAALPVAVDLARALGSDILLVQAIVPVYQVPPDLELVAASSTDQALWLVDAQDAATDYLDGLAYRLSDAEQGLRVTGVARIGQLTEVIRDLSTPAPGQLDSPIGLVVISTHGRTGLSRAILGSEADAVVHGDDVPVVLVHPHAADPLQELDRTPALFARGTH